VRRDQGATRRVLHARMQRPGRGDRVGQENPDRVQGTLWVHRNPPDRRAPAAAMTADAKGAAESVFREETGRIIATLIRISGSFHWAEEAMQEAFASALASWPEKGIPQNPAAWITTAAHRKLIDRGRKERTKRDKQDALSYETGTSSPIEDVVIAEAAMHFPD